MSRDSSTSIALTIRLVVHDEAQLRATTERLLGDIWGGPPAAEMDLGECAYEVLVGSSDGTTAPLDAGIEIIDAEWVEMRP
jgi:hypothetical protein